MNKDEYWSYLLNKSENEYSEMEYQYRIVRSLCGEIWTGGIWSYFSNCGHQYQLAREYLLKTNKHDLINCMDKVRELLYGDRFPKTEAENTDIIDKLYTESTDTELYENKYEIITEEIHWDIIKWTEEIDDAIEEWAINNGLHQ